MDTLWLDEPPDNKKPYDIALHTSKSNDWYTPEIYLKAARRVMGTIELDPASSSLANQLVKAEKYYTLETNGLDQDWRSRSLWLNPPYGRGELRTQGHVQIWIDRLISEYEQGNVQEAILLVNALTDRRWFDALWDYPICFVKTRISFLNPAHLDKQDTRPPHANAIIYFGKHENRFIEVFNQFGRIARAIAPIKPANNTLDLWTPTTVAS